MILGSDTPPRKALSLTFTKLLVTYQHFVNFSRIFCYDRASQFAVYHPKEKDQQVWWFLAETKAKDAAHSF
jgi:hypothetical protein